MNKNDNILSIEELVRHINSDYDFFYESKELREMTDEYYNILEKTVESDCEELMDKHHEIVFKAEEDYFKAGFSAGVRLLAEALGMNI